MAENIDDLARVERCDYMGGGTVQCCRRQGHEGGHRYKCAGKFCPGLGWVASNTPHPTQCNVDQSRDHDDQRLTE